MAKQVKQPIRRKKSKRERRLKVIIYIMVIAMILSTMTAGLSFLL